MQTLPRGVTNTCNLTDTKLVGYKIMRGSRNFLGGGGGGSMPDGQKWTTYFFLLLLFCPQLILQFIEGVQWFYYRENYTFPWIQKGSNIFQGGPTFSWGVLIVISKETHIMWFSRRGGPDPLSMQNCNLGLFWAAPIPLVQHTELGVLYKIRTEMRIALLYRGGRCPHSKGQMSIPSYKLDAIFFI